MCRNVILAEGKGRLHETRSIVATIEYSVLEVG
jgi:hypothetical protein